MNTNDRDDRALLRRYLKFPERPNQLTNAFTRGQLKAIRDSELAYFKMHGGSELIIERHDPYNNVSDTFTLDGARYVNLLTILESVIRMKDGHPMHEEAVDLLCCFDI